MILFHKHLRYLCLHWEIYLPIMNSILLDHLFIYCNFKRKQNYLQKKYIFISIQSMWSNHKEAKLSVTYRFNLIWLKDKTNILLFCLLRINIICDFSFAEINYFPHFCMRIVYHLRNSIYISCAQKNYVISQWWLTLNLLDVLLE